MPSSRQRARRGSNSNCGRQSPNSTANVSDTLSPEPTKRDELIPTPSKKRRVDMSSSADEDDSSGSPLIGKRLWETFESNYKFLMEEDIILTCRMSAELDVQYRRLLTGDQLGEEAGATSSSTVSLAEFVQQYTELSQWLAKLDERRRPAASAARVEKYLDQGFAEELLQRTPRKKLLHEYARALLERHPDMQAEIGERLAVLDAQWDAVERQAAGLGANIDRELLSQIVEDIYADVEDLEVWYEDLAAGLPNSNAWLQTMERLSRREVKERMTSLEAQQKDIEARSRAITHVLKLMDRVEELEAEALLNDHQSTALLDLYPVAKRLEDKCHAAWLQSLELLYCTEQFLTTPHHRLSAPPPDREKEGQREHQLASDPCNLASVMVGSWGKESGFDVRSREPSTEPPSASASLDILPFSEDEYEKIVVPPPGPKRPAEEEREEAASMRCKSRELMDDAVDSGKAEADDAFRRMHERALYSADLCYEQAGESSEMRGATLHRRSHRETVIRRQSASGRLPGASAAAEPSVYLSESELFSSGWCGWDTSVSRSAEVLLRPNDDSSLEVSQVHAVLSVTPKKAYYRMTALDHELANDSQLRNARGGDEPTERPADVPAEVKEAERARPALLDATLANLAPIGEEEMHPIGASSPLSGQKRRYSRSACAVPTVPELSPVPAPSWTSQEEEDITEEEEEEMGAVNRSFVRHGLERSASESSVIDATNRSSSWRELITQLEHDVRHSGGVSGTGADDDAGSLADESASSGGCDVPARAACSGSLSPGAGAGTPTGRTHGGRIRRMRRRTSMQLAEQAELIVQSRSRDSPVSDPDDRQPPSCPVADDSLDQAWDHYQAPMYPSACEDDEEAEEKLDLCWDEQLEATMDTSNMSGRSQRPERDLSDEGDTTIEDFIAHSSLMLERARYSRSLPPSADQTMSGLSDDLNLVQPTDLEREVARQSEWLSACDSNLSCLDHLKESLTDSGVEDDLEPIRQQVEHLLKQWTAFKEETLGRLKLIEGLHRIHDEADIIKQEAQRLADVLDAPTDPQFMDCAQLDKFSSTLEYYASSLPGWQIAVDEMQRTLCSSLEQDQVEYLDVRKCHVENLHLLGQWIFSLHTRTGSMLTHVGELRSAYDALMSQLFESGEALGREEHLLRCTRLAVDIMNHDEREAALRDLKELRERLHDIDAGLAAGEEQAARLAPAFSRDHWQHVDSRITALGSRLVALKDNCADLKDTISARRGAERPKLVRPSPSPKMRRRLNRAGPKSSGAGAEGEVARQAVNTWRGRRLWRYLRASLPYQLALLVLFGCVYYLLADQECDGRMGNFLFSPQLRQAFGSPY